LFRILDNLHLFHHGEWGARKLRKIKGRGVK
jgi:hypothetical protein